MEQTRLFIAIGISFFIFFIWSTFFAPAPPEAPPKATNETTTESTPDPSQASGVQETTPPVQKQNVPPSGQPAQAMRKARQIVVDNALFRMTLSEKGGTVTSLVLKEYRENTEPDSPLKELIHKDSKSGSVFLSLSGQTGPTLDQALFTADSKEDSINVTDDNTRIEFSYRTPSGLVVKKIYRFLPNSYLVDLKVTVFNASGHPYQGSLGLGLANTIDKDAGRIAFEGPTGVVNGSLEQISVKDIEENNKLSGKIGWIAIEDRYFMTSIIPSSDFNGHMSLAFSDNLIKNQIVKDVSGLSPQQAETIEAKLFVGPKSLKLLKSYNNGLHEAINFGWFDILAKPCLWFMNFIYNFIPNYGIAIIILTIVSRAIFWPLAKKSYKSMGEMRKVQPLLQEIREKNKDNKAQMNKEMMDLYKAYKINPMGGCLPMLIQMPVFFALYRMLYSAIELRHAPFFAWITDLSAPDRLGNFDFSLPLMDAPTGIPVLTIIMTISMLLQQKMTPAPGDPAQAKLMMLMPVVFFFIFMNFSSGLVLYWLVSNIFSMAQQYLTQKTTA